MDFKSYESWFFEDNTALHQGPKRNVAQIVTPGSIFNGGNFSDAYDIFNGGSSFSDAYDLFSGVLPVEDTKVAPTCQLHLTLPLNQYCLTCSEMLCSECVKIHLNQKNCHTCSLRTMKLTCTEVFQNLSTRIQVELEKYKKERQNVEETDVKVKQWMGRARSSLAELKQTFIDHLDKAFESCEEAISKQANSVEVMKEVYEGYMLKGQILLDGIRADFNAPQDLAKAYRDSAAYTNKVDTFLQQKPVLPLLPDLDENFPPPSPNTIAKILAQATNYSYCADLVKHEPCSPVSASSGIFKEFSPMKMKLNYDVNFGSFGVEDGQFSEPAGICVTHEGLIAVTDTKNHRVQVFDEIGCLKIAFGVSGNNPGQLLYPNCIASCPVTGNFVITERTPVHQVQVYSSAGHFIRRFGQNLIQFPRGVTVDKAGNIIVVECKVMRVTIFDQLGNVIRTFTAPSVMSFPMDICVNDNHEIFIVDNRRHCVHVFDYNGNNLRTICGNGSISFPISVSINSVGELVVTDNHQSFNMTFFNQNGELVRAYESRNRHLQCLASAVHGVDKIFLATKDFRVYMYNCSKGK